MKLSPTEVRNLLKATEEIICKARVKLKSLNHHLGLFILGVCLWFWNILQACLLGISSELAILVLKSP